MLIALSKKDTCKNRCPGLSEIIHYFLNIFFLTLPRTSSIRDGLYEEGDVTSLKEAL